ncbi:MAG: Dabb family protein [Deltaproteobacteria bacterium]|nr:Dabb family protein [Deltaproteobacteria bacterium]
MITHVVLFKLADKSPGTIRKVEEMLLALKGKVPQVRSIEVGKDVLRSARSYDIALTVRFDSLKDLEAYQVHPDHREAADYIAKVREAIAVVDYESA